MPAIKTVNAWEARSLAGMQGDAVNAPNLEQACKDLEKRARDGFHTCECTFTCTDDDARSLCSALQTLGFKRSWARNDAGEAVVNIDWSGI